MILLVEQEEKVVMTSVPHAVVIKAVHFQLVISMFYKSLGVSFLDWSRKTQPLLIVYLLSAELLMMLESVIL